MSRKYLSITGSVRVDPGDGRLVLVPDDESALRLKHAADVQFGMTLHAHDRAEALRSAGKHEEAEAQDKKDASIEAAVEKMLADKEAANQPPPAPAEEPAADPEVK